MPRVSGNIHVAASNDRSMSPATAVYRYGSVWAPSRATMAIGSTCRGGIQPAPAIVIAGAGGATASATATVEPCAARTCGATVAGLETSTARAPQLSQNAVPWLAAPHEAQ